MFEEELKKVIEAEYGPIDKMTSEKKTEVFLNTYKHLMIFFERDFVIDSVSIAEIKLATKKDEQTIQPKL